MSLGRSDPPFFLFLQRFLRLCFSTHGQSIPGFVVNIRNFIPDICILSIPGDEKNFSRFPGIHIQCLRGFQPVCFFLLSKHLFRPRRGRNRARLPAGRDNPGSPLAGALNRRPASGGPGGWKKRSAGMGVVVEPSPAARRSGAPGARPGRLRRPCTGCPGRDRARAIEKSEGPATCRAKASHGGGQPPAGLPLCAAKC